MGSTVSDLSFKLNFWKFVFQHYQEKQDSNLILAIITEYNEPCLFKSFFPNLRLKLLQTIFFCLELFFQLEVLNVTLALTECHREHCWKERLKEQAEMCLIF